ncbi:MAG: DUF4330 domain-containing protein [Clostridia bacterium]|nr:DUF4330 domain-containing protein [Clostridia bacterium]
MILGTQNKKRFNIIDVVLILAILAVIAGVAIRSGFTGSLSQKLDNGYIEYDFIINSVKDTSGEYFVKGKKIFSQTTQKEIGEIISATARPAEAYIELSTGEIAKTYIPGRIDVLGKAKVSGNLDSDGRCMLHGTTHIATGKTIYARTADVSFMFTVENAEFVSDNPGSDSAENRDTLSLPQQTTPDDVIAENVEVTE